MTEMVTSPMVTFAYQTREGNFVCFLLEKIWIFDFQYSERRFQSKRCDKIASNEANPR